MLLRIKRILSIQWFLRFWLFNLRIGDLFIGFLGYFKCLINSSGFYFVFILDWLLSLLVISCLWCSLLHFRFLLNYLSCIVTIFYLSLLLNWIFSRLLLRLCISLNLFILRRIKNTLSYSLFNFFLQINRLNLILQLLNLLLFLFRIIILLNLLLLFNNFLVNFLNHIINIYVFLTLINNFKILLWLRLMMSDHVDILLNLL